MKEPVSAPLSARADERLVRVLTVLHQEPGREYEWEALAQGVNLSLRHLERLFKQATGQTLPQYLHDLRLRAACELLATTFLSAKQIAAKLGFKYETSFHRAFKQATGLTPIAYRRRCETEKKAAMSD